MAATLVKSAVGATTHEFYERLHGQSSRLGVLRSLRVHLLILVLGAMLPGTLLTGVLVWRAFANNRVASERRLLDSARVDAAALDREFVSTLSTLQALSTSPTLDRDDLEGFFQEARRVQSTQPGWYAVVLLSTDSRPLVSTQLPWGTAPTTVVEPESLQRMIATRQPTVGVVRPAPDGSAQHLFAIRVPVLRAGELKYALSAIVTVDWLARVVPRQQPNSDEWTRTILDSAGTIAVRTRGPEHYVGAPAGDAFRARLREAAEFVSRDITRDGVAVYAAASRTNYGWTAVVVVPRGVIDRPLRASTTALLAGGALLMLGGFAAVFVVSRRLSADLVAAGVAAQTVAEGRPFRQSDGYVVETTQLQRSLATAASLLEKRARERDEEIRRADTARTEAERANQTKDQFLAVLGHELRNPLAPALTALELMKVRDPRAFEREREVLERQVAHMARLVNDLLDISRTARGKIQLERRRIELREAVDSAVDMARPLLEQQRHTLDVAVPATGLAVDVDVDRIVQVLANLLTNAAKYTPPGGHVLLAASASGGRIRIVCEDNGPGVPEELVPSLFDPFAQGPRALDRREGGLGLGLALARTFTELHGGTIHVESRGQSPGSRFVVELPSGAPIAADVPNEPSAPPSVLPQRVLLVDDNEDARELMRVALDRAGHQVVTAENGIEAVTVASTFRPDVGVLDIGLPGIDGYELASRLRAAHGGIKLIALTGYGQQADRDAARAAGFDAHCAKPVTTAALLELIDGLKTGDAAAR
jgi:signal transduction histidine kinase